MPSTTVQTLSTPYGKWAGTDLTTTTYSVTIGLCLDDPGTAPAASATRAIMDLSPTPGGATDGNILQCYPVLVGANNAVITGMRVFGWRLLRSGASGSLKPVWCPALLFELAMVAGNIAGPSGGVLDTTYFAMDTITLVNPTVQPNWLEVFSPVSVTADLPGWFRFDTQGFQKVEMVVDLGANATGFNCLYGKY